MRLEMKPKGLLLASILSVVLVSVVVSDDAKKAEGGGGSGIQLAQIKDTVTKFVKECASGTNFVCKAAKGFLSKLKSGIQMGSKMAAGALSGRGLGFYDSPYGINYGIPYDIPYGFNYGNPYGIPYGGYPLLSDPLMQYLQLGQLPQHFPVVTQYRRPGRPAPFFPPPAPVPGLRTPMYALPPAYAF